MSRVMSWVVQEGLVRFGLSARRGHALAVQLHGQNSKKSGQSRMHGHHAPTAASSRQRAANPPVQPCGTP
jgi:hypothetical protein